MEIEKIEPLDYNDLDNDLDDWTIFYSLLNGSLGEKLIEFSKEFIFFDEALLYKLLISYIATPSTLARVLPILFLCGDSGSGKSTVGKFASCLWYGANWGQEILSPNDTFAAIRNAISERKYHFSELEDEAIRQEKNGIMIWDDIDPSLLIEESPIYRLLKVSCDKATDSISIATKDGKNIKFRTFLPKIASTVSNLFLNSDLIELHRRSIVIPLFPLPENKTITSIESIDWKGFDVLLWNFWNTKENCLAFIRNRKSLNRKKWFHVSNKRKAISTDIAATGLTLGIFADKDDAISSFVDYWEYFDMTICPESKTLLERCIDSFLQEQQELCKKLERPFTKFSTKELSRFLKNKRDLDIIENYTQKECDTYAKTLGWIKDIDGFYHRKNSPSPLKPDIEMVEMFEERNTKNIEGMKEFNNNYDDPMDMDNIPF